MLLIELTSKGGIMLKNIKIHNVGLIILFFSIFMLLSHSTNERDTYAAEKPEAIIGIAKNQPTNIRTSASTSSSILKQFNQGAVLEYRTYANNPFWYEMTIHDNGILKKGFVHRNHVENSQNAEFIRGIAKQNTTNIRTMASTTSKVLTTVPIGTVLEYKSFSTYWYEVRVKVGGDIKNGYIHRNHVENTPLTQEFIKATTKNNPTFVRSSASTSSAPLKTIPRGENVEVKKFSEFWYEVSVNVDGEFMNGYIHRNHLDVKANMGEAVKGVASKATTNIRTEPSTQSTVLTSFSQGTVLEFRPYHNNPNWYELIIEVNGRYQTGYVHINHVDTITANKTVSKSITLKQPTMVRSNASVKSDIVHRLNQGDVIEVNPFSEDWNRLTMNINGKTITGYVHNNHIEKVSANTNVRKAVAIRNPTFIRKSASTSADSLITYRQNTIIDFKPFSRNWYEVGVNINDQFEQGYVHANHINENAYIVTEYESEFYAVVDEQMKHAPQVWVPGGGFTDATREQVAYYINSSNFHEGDPEFFQFLDLSSTAGVNANELNNKILKGKGTLDGTGAAFISGGEQFSVNEIYLISHAIHETGHGTSTLAQGVPVDHKGDVVDAKDSQYTVYNMYGIGAFDSCPLTCGAKYAFEQGWFTPESAVIGGAEFIGRNYIAKGQNTLYKMRWNPDAPGTHQYATDVAWAVAQTKNIANLYNLLDDYVLIFDIPKYQGQPEPLSRAARTSIEKESYVEFSEATEGQTTSEVNLRDQPTTEGSNIDEVIPANTEVLVIGSDGHWVKVEYNEQIGWIHGEFITF